MKNFTVFCGDSGTYEKYYKASDSNVFLKQYSQRLIAVECSQYKDFNIYSDGNVFCLFDGVIYTRDNNECADISDSEYAASTYLKYGKDMFSHFEGKFLLALVDIQKGIVISSRDHFGSAPLYYTVGDGFLLLSSALARVSNSAIIKKELDPEGLADYFTLNYVPAPKTMFKNISAMCPGNFAEYNLINKSLNIKCYWDVNPDEKNMIEDEQQCKEKLRAALINSVDMCTQNAQNGVFLSGGIDSTVITGIASNILGKKIDSFTMGFKEEAFDESPRALIAAKACNTNHHLYTLDYDDVLSELDKIIYGFDQPLADASAIPTWIINRFAASQGIKNVLTGDGSDQIFSGSNKYLIKYYVDKYKAFPAVLRVPFEKLFYLLPDTSSVTRKIRKVVSCASMSTYEMRRRMLQLCLPEAEIGSLLISPPAVINDTVARYYDIHKDKTDELTNTLYVDLKVVADGCMMTKMGSMSRMAGINTHMPILSREVLNCAFSTPAKFKLQKTRGKLILKNTFSDVIPEELYAASKKGFDPPIASWFRGPLESDLKKVLCKNDICDAKILNYNYIETLINEHSSLKCDRSTALWALYSFQKWYAKEFN